MPTRKVRDILAGLGCVKTTTEGSHEKWTSPQCRSVIVVAAEKEQSAGTLRNIQTELVAEFGAKWFEKASRR